MISTHPVIMVDIPVTGVANGIGGGIVANTFPSSYIKLLILPQMITTFFVYIPMESCN